jgi:N utilization substance protein A
VVQELKGEKIDIIPYSPDIAHYVASALAPAGVIRVVVDEQARSLEVVVPDEQLSLAIGRKGQNVRLASRLVGWRIDVKNESKYQRALKDGYQSLIRLPGVGEFTADLLFEAGYGSARDLLEVDPEQLAMIEGITIAKARQVWDAAKEYIEILEREDAAEAAQAAMAKDFFSPRPQEREARDKLKEEAQQAPKKDAEEAPGEPEDEIEAPLEDLEPKRAQQAEPEEAQAPANAPEAQTREPGPQEAQASADALEPGSQEARPADPPASNEAANEGGAFDAANPSGDPEAASQEDQA